MTMLLLEDPYMWFTVTFLLQAEAKWCTPSRHNEDVLSLNEQIVSIDIHSNIVYRVADAVSVIVC